MKILLIQTFFNVGLSNYAVDDPLLDSAIGFVLEASEQYGVKPSKKQIAKWTSLIYDAAVDLQLNVRQTRGMAKLLVKTSKGNE